MSLLTDELRRVIHPLYAQEHAADPTVYCRFFALGSSWTWYVTEFDGEALFFGLVDGHEVELGYFSLSELESLKWQSIPRIERDIHFTARPLSQVKAEIGRRRNCG